MRIKCLRLLNENLKGVMTPMASPLIGLPERRFEIVDWLSFASYGIAFPLAWKWTGLWDFRCGTQAFLHSQICGFFALIAFSVAAWAGLQAHNWKASLRCALAGSVPVIFPYCVYWVARFF